MRDIYFAYAHLPANLQAISKPFCETSKQPNNEWIDWLIGTVREMPVTDHIEKNECLKKLGQARKEKSVDTRLRLILEAKDCAVRASIPNQSK